MSEENHLELLSNEIEKFTEDFKMRIKRCKRWQDAQLSLLGRVLLFEGVKAVYGRDLIDKKVSYTEFNKPYYEDDLISFNISHSGEMVVCAMCEKIEIGIDLELKSDIDLNDFKSQFTDNEFNYILNCIDEKDSFFDFWTKKEAVVKAEGRGMSIPFESFEVFGLSTKIKEREYFFKEIFLDEKYKCNIASNYFIADNKIEIKYLNFCELFQLKQISD